MRGWKKTIMYAGMRDGIRWRKCLRWLCLGIGLLYLSKLLFDSAEQIDIVLENSRLPILMVAASIGVLANFLMAALFYVLMQRYGYHGGACTAFRAFLLGQVAKYTPGKVWALWVQADLLSTPRRWQIIFFVNVDCAIISMVVALTSIGVGLKIEFPMLVSAILIVGCCLCVLCARASVILRWVYSIAGRFRRVNMFDFGVDRFCGTELVVLIFGYSILSMLALMLMLYSCFDMNLSETGAVMAQLSFAWIVGAVAFVVPGGVGVREAAFIWISSQSEPTVSWSMLTAIAVISRLWLTVLDFAGSIIGVSLLMVFRRFG